MTQDICRARRVAIRQMSWVMCGALYRIGDGTLSSAPAGDKEHDRYWLCDHTFGHRQPDPGLRSIAAPVFPHLGPEEQ